jgi:hypothetical protein
MTEVLDYENQALVREGIIQPFARLADLLAEAITAPHVLMRPGIARDGNKWSALYGDNLMDGVCGFGDTPAEAMADFDRSWREQRITVHEDTTPTIGALMDAIMEPDADCTAETVRAEYEAAGLDYDAAASKVLGLLDEIDEAQRRAEAG